VAARVAPAAVVAGAVTSKWLGGTGGGERVWQLATIGASQRTSSRKKPSTPIRLSEWNWNANQTVWPAIGERSTSTCLNSLILFEVQMRVVEALWSALS